MSTEEKIELTCAMPAKITLLKHLAKHIDFVLKCQVNVAFIISAHIITRNFFFVKKLTMILKTKKKKGGGEKPKRKQTK